MPVSRANFWASAKVRPVSTGPGHQSPSAWETTLNSPRPGSHGGPGPARRPDRSGSPRRCLSGDQVPPGWAQARARRPRQCHRRCCRPRPRSRRPTQRARFPEARIAPPEVRQLRRCYTTGSSSRRQGAAWHRPRSPHLSRAGHRAARRRGNRQDHEPGRLHSCSLADVSFAARLPTERVVAIGKRTFRRTGWLKRL
jgi:hypothetical protein